MCNPKTKLVSQGSPINKQNLKDLDFLKPALYMTIHLYFYSPYSWVTVLVAIVTPVADEMHLILQIQLLISFTSSSCLVFYKCTLDAHLNTEKPQINL